MLSNAHIWSSLHDEINPIHRSLQTSSPRLRRSCSSNALAHRSKERRVSSGRDVPSRPPREPAWCRGHRSPVGRGQLAQAAVTSSWGIICSWSRRHRVWRSPSPGSQAPAGSAGCCNLVLLSFFPPLAPPSLVFFTFSVYDHFPVPCNLSNIFSSTLSRHIYYGCYHILLLHPLQRF